MKKSDFVNKNSLWSGVLVDAFQRLGVEAAVISPGARSAPLTYAFSTNERIETIPVLDERSASFFALGLAKRSHKPVVLICTSGTAAANYFPAIIEAHYSRVPLIVLTADRPPELRDCSAGQTIDQIKLYQSYVNWNIELAMPSSQLMKLRYLRQTVMNAYQRCLYPVAGPVHLNIPFDEPLAPIEADEPMEVGLTEVKALMEGISVPQPGHASPIEFPHKEKMLAAKKGLIIAGTAEPQRARDYAAMIKCLANYLGWPIVCDVLSPLRNCESEASSLIINYDLILRDPVAQKKLEPELVLNIGPLPTSKGLRTWLQALNTPTYILDDGWNNLDPLHRNAVKFFINPLDCVHLLQGPDRPLSPYGKQWLLYESLADSAVKAAMEACDFFFEGKVPYLLSQQLPEQTPVFIANSMPIRDAEYFWQKNGNGYLPFFNRGANGIDGTLSTALGMAYGNSQPAVLLTGDLAFLHDINGLLIRTKFYGSLTIVLVNNNGGGIFENLPISTFDPPFEDYFATPQSIDMQQLAALHELDYYTPNDWNDFIDLIKALPSKGIRLIEVKTDRKRDTVTRKDILNTSLKQ